MSDGVKFIFKTLLGTILLIVVSSLLIEWFNVTITSLQLNSTAKMAARQAAVLFSQETYKTDGNSGSSSLANVRYSGGIYVSGDFYGSADAETIWRELYTSPAYKAWVASPEVQRGDWRSLRILNNAVTGNTNISSTPGWGASQSELNEYNEKLSALTYLNALYTPLNMGIPYLDKDITTKMFQWNLAQLLSNCDPDNIHLDDNGQPYVMYKGFRCYAREAKINNLNYQVFDLGNAGERLSFKNVTGIDAQNLGFTGGGGALGIDEDERQRVCVVGIEYDLPVAYEGITPIKNIFEWVWNNEVEGMDGDYDFSYKESWNDTAQHMTAGGINGRTGPEAGIIPTTGRLMYYLVR